MVFASIVILLSNKFPAIKLGKKVIKSEGKKKKKKEKKGQVF